MRASRRLWIAGFGVLSSLGLAIGCNLIVGSVFDVSLVEGGLADAHDARAPLDPRCRIIGQDAGGPAVSDASVPIRIGAILPMTLPMDGGPDLAGVYRLQAIRLAFNQLSPPVRGGVNGRSLEVVVCDNSADSTQAAALASNLIDQGVSAIIGATSSDILNEATVTVPKRVLLMSSSSTAAEISQLSANDPVTGVRLVWRTAPPDTFQGRVMARVLASGIDGGGARADAAPSSLGIFEVNNAYGQGLVAAIQAEYPGSSSNVGIYTENGDASAAVAAVAAFTPAAQRLVAIAFPADAVNLANGAFGSSTLRSLQWFFSDSAKSPQIFVGLQHAAQFEGALGTAPAAAATTSPAFAYFNTEFQQTYGENQANLAFIPNTFDAAMLLALAVSYASAPGYTLDGPTMAKALTMVSADSGPLIPLDPLEFDTASNDLAAGQAINIEGASGNLDFDPKTGEAPAAIEVWQVVDGGFTTLSVEQP